MPIKDYYEILEVEYDASIEDIKRSFRKLARKYHPDSTQFNLEESQDRFQEISEAYDVLSDEDTRKTYDAKIDYLRKRKEQQQKEEYLRQQRDADRLKERRDGKFGTMESDIQGLHEKVKEAEATLDRKRKAAEGQESASSAAEQVEKKSDSYTRPSENALFRKLTDGLRSRLSASGNKDESAGGRNNSSGKRPKERGSTYQRLRGERKYQFTINALESITGAERELAIGSLHNPTRVKVVIPPGTSDGATINVNNPDKANSVVRVNVNVEPHPLFERKGNDLIVKIPITISEAILGAEINAPTLDGPVRVKIPKRFDTSRRLRVKGKGIDTGSADNRGDLYIQAYVVVPSGGTNLLEEIARAMDDHYTEPVRKEVPKSLRDL